MVDLSNIQLLFVRRVFAWTCADFYERKQLVTMYSNNCILSVLKCIRTWSKLLYSTIIRHTICESVCAEPRELKVIKTLRQSFFGGNLFKWANYSIKKCSEAETEKTRREVNCDIASSNWSEFKFTWRCLHLNFYTGNINQSLLKNSIWSDWTNWFTAHDYCLSKCVSLGSLSCKMSSVLDLIRK